MDRGDLVPDDLIIKMIIERLQEPDTESGFILDGFPRTRGQAEALDRELEELGRSLTAALLFEVERGRGDARLSGRRVCVKNAAQLPRRVQPAQARGPLRPGRQPARCSVTTTARRSSGTGSRSTARRPSR